MTRVPTRFCVTPQPLPLPRHRRKGAAKVKRDGCPVCEGRCAFCGGWLKARPSPSLGYCDFCDVTYFETGTRLGDRSDPPQKRRNCRVPK